MFVLQRAGRAPVIPALGLAVLVASVTALSGVPAADAPGYNSPLNHCAGKIEPPVRVGFTTSESAIAPGTVVVEGYVEIDEDSPAAVLRFGALELATLAGPAEQQLGPVVAGQVVAFSIPVTFPASGRGAITVTAELQDEFGALRSARKEGIYALIRPEGIRTGNGGFLALEQRVVLENIESGALFGEEADAALAQMAQTEGSVSDQPPAYRAFTPMERQLNELIGAPADGHVPAAVQGPSSMSLANITIEGTVQWTDENGTLHPVYGANVDIYDEDLVFDEYLTTVVTDQNGNYQAVVDDDDGIGQGDRDIYVVVRAENSWIRTENMSNDVYQFTSSTFDETPGGSLLNYSPTAGNTGNGPAWSIFQASTWILAYLNFDLGESFSQLNVEWPNGGTGSFYDGEVNMEQEDRWDWDTVHHEIGHWVMDQINIENNPGGPHNIGDCIAQVRGGKSEGNELAWGEGWPTYWGTSGQFEMNMAALNVPRVGDNVYQDVEDGSVVYSLESQDNNGRGEDNEVAVQRLLWDLYDNASDGRDNISRTDNSIYAAIKGGAGSPHILSNYWGDLRSGQSTANQLLMGEIASDHLIGPRLVSPADNGIVSPSNLLFDWQADVGCPSSYSGDSFDLKFWDANTLALLLTVPNIGTSQYSLTLAQLQGMIATTHNVIWAVEGRHTGSPATGPYLGENRNATLNTPPVADAGPDQPAVECTSPTTTPVQLDGTGSSDADGDALTYSWSAPGVVFDNPNSATPTGQFPAGTKVVTLTVSDGIQQDTDQVSITVVDTTPPDITCPAPITVECSEHGGTPADHPDLAPFFAGVSATDICDTTPTITNDAPAFFPLGDTDVTFTATDDDGNSSDCTVTVTVEDTTPPEITVTLNRYALWPPNHKLAMITATVEVTDICDPNPTFVLTSITSNEPDNGLGDGDTANDIQEADYGTADTAFKLRSERAGTGSGRKYTIIYTASDISGNTTPDTSCVRVSHSQSGTAMASSGFVGNGTWVEEGAQSIRLVIHSGAIDADRILLDQAYIGNVSGAALPRMHWIQDTNQDGRQDLVLAYATDDIREIRRLSRRSEPLGLHYTVDGTDYLVGDIFRLGAPMMVLVEGDDPTPGEQITDASLRDDEASGGMAAERGTVTVSQTTVFDVTVFDIQGRQVRNMSLVLDVGAHELNWDGRDNSGRPVPSGVYFYRVQAPGLSHVAKILITR